MDRLGENEPEVEHFDSQILGGGSGDMIDDPREVPSLDFDLNADIRMLCLPLVAELISTAKVPVEVRSKMNEIGNILAHNRQQYLVIRTSWVAPNG